ncbi:uroporphyrinogen-III synthase [Mesorhizobium sp. J428]|uniref:uroporphyrinogen-III synthase n=1 Tax=Mesorhizobium sp. J428 TaxID=2898440 RepID=UPI002151524E|nr:uroporphyrinogen-III synthase [Mesorhizobium sp. J428]MCR5857031.1 uroporphyrinogen-III synthase [Mesorhizobium sp. J428]
MTAGPEPLRRVLVTRPEPGASATARALRLAGFEPVVLPLTEIRPLPAKPVDAQAIDAVAITSANALRHASPSLLAELARCPLYAVGKATAETAREAGFLNISVGPGDADGLVRLICDRLGADATVAYLCGRLRRPDFEEGLRQHGIRPVPVETYDTLTARIGKDAVRRLGTAPFFTVLVHSAEAAKALATLAPDPAFVPLLANARLVAISRRAAEPAAPLFPERIVIAEEPNDRAMAAALSGLL